MKQTKSFEQNGIKYFSEGEVESKIIIARAEEREKINDRIREIAFKLSNLEDELLTLSDEEDREEQDKAIIEGRIRIDELKKIRIGK